MPDCRSVPNSGPIRLNTYTMAKRGPKTQPPMTQNEKISATLKAQHLVRKSIVDDLVLNNIYMEDGETYRTLNREMKNHVISVLANGGTVTQAAAQLGVSKGVINMARHIDDAFKEEFYLARKAGAAALADRIREIPRDETLSDARAKLEFDALKWIASRYDRTDYGEHIKVDQTVTVQPVAMPDWSFGQVIDAKPIEGDPDEDELD